MKKIVLSLLVMALFAVPARVQGDPIIEYHQVGTSVGFGSLYINGTPDHEAFASGTFLSQELAQTIEDTYPAGGRLSQLSETYGTLSNYDFLTQNLIGLGNAGDQIENAFNSFFNTYNANLGGIASLSLSRTDLGVHGYSLFGGVLDSSGNFIDPNTYQGQVTIVTGEGTVNFYEVNGYITYPTDGQQISTVPVPASILLLGTGLIGVFAGRRSKAQRTS